MYPVFYASLPRSLARFLPAFSVSRTLSGSSPLLQEGTFHETVALNSSPTDDSCRIWKSSWSDSVPNVIRWTGTNETISTTRFEYLSMNRPHESRVAKFNTLGSSRSSAGHRRDRRREESTPVPKLGRNSSFSHYRAPRWTCDGRTDGRAEKSCERRPVPSVPVRSARQGTPGQHGRLLTNVIICVTIS